MDTSNESEIRINDKSVKALNFIKNIHPRAIALDHITWVSEDQSIGNLRTMTGQYLEYLPEGAGRTFKDAAGFYLSDETAAYDICRKYNIELVIIRKQLLMLTQLNVLFADPELKSDDYFIVSRKSPGSSTVDITFNPRGQNTMLFKMLRSQQLNKFQLVYEDKSPNTALADIVVYKPTP